MRSRFHQYRQPHLCRVRLGVCHAHTSINAAVAKVLDVSWQRRRVHFMRNAPAHAGKRGRRILTAFIATAFTQDDAEAVGTQWRCIADRLRTKLPKLASLDEAIVDVGFRPIGDTSQTGIRFHFRVDVYP